MASPVSSNLYWYKCIALLVAGIAGLEPNPALPLAAQAAKQLVIAVEVDLGRQ